MVSTRLSVHLFLYNWYLEYVMSVVLIVLDFLVERLARMTDAWGIYSISGYEHLYHVAIARDH